MEFTSDSVAVMSEDGPITGEGSGTGMDTGSDSGSGNCSGCYSGSDSGSDCCSGYSWFFLQIFFAEFPHR